MFWWTWDFDLPGRNPRLMFNAADLIPSHPKVPTNRSIPITCLIWTSIRQKRAALQNRITDADVIIVQYEVSQGVAQNATDVPVMVKTIKTQYGTILLSTINPWETLANRPQTLAIVTMVAAPSAEIPLD